MALSFYEAIVGDRKLPLLEPVALPEQTRVYAVVPQPKLPETASCKVIRTPRLKGHVILPVASFSAEPGWKHSSPLAGLSCQQQEKLHGRLKNLHDATNFVMEVS